MNRKKIMIDMDDVITIKGFERLVKEFLGYELDWKQAGENYYWQDLLEDKKDDFFQFFITKNMYDYVDIREDSIRVIEKLNNEYDVYICTDYIWREVIENAGLNLKNKYDFLYRNFPFLDPRKFIFVGDKSIINCDIKIDDKLTNLSGNCELKLLFSEQHNKNLSDKYLKEQEVIRVNDWNEIEKIILEGVNCL